MKSGITMPLVDSSFGTSSSSSPILMPAAKPDLSIKTLPELREKTAENFSRDPRLGGLKIEPNTISFATIARPLHGEDFAEGADAIKLLTMIKLSEEIHQETRSADFSSKLRLLTAFARHLPGISLVQKNELLDLLKRANSKSFSSVVGFRLSLRKIAMELVIANLQSIEIKSAEVLNMTEEKSPDFTRANSKRRTSDVCDDFDALDLEHTKKFVRSDSPSTSSVNRSPVSMSSSLSVDVNRSLTPASNLAVRLANLNSDISASSSADSTPRGRRTYVVKRSPSMVVSISSSYQRSNSHSSFFSPKKHREGFSDAELVDAIDKGDVKKVLEIVEGNQEWHTKPIRGNANAETFLMHALRGTTNVEAIIVALLPNTRVSLTHINSLLALTNRNYAGDSLIEIADRHGNSVALKNALAIASLSWGKYRDYGDVVDGLVMQMRADLAAASSSDMSSAPTL